MPQIDAPTVAEHRAQQREALLDAAEAILLADGHGALTFRALGARTGLARNSIYRYFASRDDLIAALCERDMPRWLEELEAAMAAADGPDARVAAFVSTQLRLVARGSHRMAELLGDAPLGPAVRARINALAYRPAALLSPSCGADARVTAQLDPGRRQRRRSAAARRGHLGRRGAADRGTGTDARPLARLMVNRKALIICAGSTVIGFAMLFDAENRSVGADVDPDLRRRRARAGRPVDCPAARRPPAASSAVDPSRIPRGPLSRLNRRFVPADLVLPADDPDALVRTVVTYLEQPERRPELARTG